MLKNSLTSFNEIADTLSTSVMANNIKQIFTILLSDMQVTIENIAK